ncbi:tetratricopeptide repeat protein [Fulvivirgaceae bacterium BMA10]|uniref:Tetratricopeptide repeat protein n=1 Tax=Splendidivirga corallicola TaxID=3051826 RepID=A0ABT8KRS2_9BACT|nr:tetratricopeptide repeat protein [Fulvivirgaceae bacterium BMA10]
MKKISIISVFCFLLFSGNYTAECQNVIDKLYTQQTIDSLRKQLAQASDKDKLPLLNALAESYWQIDPDLTIEYANQALKLAEANGDKKNEGYAYINLCQGYLYKDVYDKALEFGLKSLDIREKLEDVNDVIYTLRTIGWLYYDIKNSDMAQHYHEKVLALHLELKNPERIAYSYNSLGLIDAQKGEHQKALSDYKKSLKLKEPIGNKERISETLKNMGTSYEAIDHDELALSYLSRSLRIFDEIDDQYRMAEVLNKLALVYLKLSDYGNSEQSLHRAKSIINEIIDNKELLMEHYLVSSDLYAQLGNDKNAFQYFQLHTDLKNDILSQKKNHELAEMRVSYEAEKRENEIKLLEREKEIVNVKRQALTVGIILIAIIAILIIARLKSNQRKRRAIYEAKEALAAEKLKNEHLIQEKLKDELQFKSQELINFGLHISQKNEIYKKFIRQLQELDFMNRNDASKKIKSLIRYFGQQLRFNDTIDDYESSLNQLNEDFFFHLHNKFPNLTDNEKRLAAQLRLKLSSKAISDLNNVSIKSVEISRYRLRKKLNLKNGESLTEFIQAI